MAYRIEFESRKGRHLLARPMAALLFHWKSLRRQVRIEGQVHRVSDAEADAYFQSRARDSRIGAWASPQSRPLKGKFELEKRVADPALSTPSARFHGRPIGRVSGLSRA